MNTITKVKKRERAWRERRHGLPRRPEADTARSATVRRVSLALFLALLFAYALLSGFNTVTRTGKLSPDSMAYIEAAQNLVAGRGLSLAHRMTHLREHLGDMAHLIPLGYWAPLYPLMIAGLHTLGVPGLVAGLLVSAVFSGLLLLFFFLFMRALYGSGAATFGAAALMHLEAFRYISGFAWSESAAITFLFVGCLCAAAYMPRYAFGAAAAGLCFGLAFAARYAMLPALLLGLTALWPCAGWRIAVKKLAAYALGYAAAAAPVVIRNYLRTGRLLGPARPPSSTGLLENSWMAAQTFLRHYLPLDMAEPGIQGMLMAFTVVLLLSVVLYAQRWKALRCLMSFSGGRVLLPAWIVLYTVFLVVHRSVYDADPIGVRLLAPAAIPLALFAVTLMRSILGGRDAAWCILGLILAIAALGREGRVAVETEPQTMASRLNASERLQWICENTSKDDLIIGDATMDIPLYCGFRQSLCFMPWEHDEWHLQYAVLQRFLAVNGSRYHRIFLIIRAGLRPEPFFEERWRARFGDFITDLVYGRLSDYPEIAPLASLDDAFIFTVRQ